MDFFSNWRVFLGPVFLGGGNQTGCKRENGDNFGGFLRVHQVLGWFSCNDTHYPIGGHGGNRIEGIFWWEDGI